MPLYTLGKDRPNLTNKENIWVAPSAQLIGNIILEQRSNIWFNTVLRGDNEPIYIGKQSNIQDLVMLHTDMGYPLSIGEGCTIGHKAMLHGCTIGKNTLIGMGAIILNGATLGDNCLIGAGALITENKKIPDGSVVLGAPAHIKRKITDDEIKAHQQSSLHYYQNAMRFKKELR